jgi:hypothetical protein
VVGLRRRLKDECHPSESKDSIAGFCRDSKTLKLGFVRIQKLSNLTNVPQAEPFSMDEASSVGRYIVRG